MTRPDQERPASPGRPTARWIATSLGAGLLPLAPGTAGTLVALPVHFALAELAGATHLAIIVATFALGAWAADETAHALQQPDPPIVVVDESAGILLALWVAAPQSLLAVAVTTLLFRALDIVKPWPISASERLRPAGLGIMADDFCAGLAAGLLVRWLS